MAKRTADLPIHFRTGLRALGIVGGKPVWPIMGGDDSADAAAEAAAAKAAADAATAKAAADAAANGKVDGEFDFPANKPLAEMTEAQRTEYWRHKARKHEDRVNSLGSLTAAELTALREKATKHDALEAELGTTADKAAAKAADDAKAAAKGEYQPALITARLDAAAARAGVSEEDLAKAVEFVDTAKFLAADGTVDADKVKAFVATITPATGTQQQQRKGPPVTGHGSGNGTGSGLSGLSGSDLFDRLHPKAKTDA